MNQGSRVIINPWLLLKNIVANLTQLSESMMDLCWPEVETTQYSLISTPIFELATILEYTDQPQKLNFNINLKLQRKL